MSFKRYYCVTSSFDDLGHADAKITNSCLLNKKPNDYSFSTRYRDIYVNWFDSFAEARKYVTDTKYC